MCLFNVEIAPYLAVVFSLVDAMAEYYESRGMKGLVFRWNRRKRQDYVLRWMRPGRVLVCGARDGLLGRRIREHFGSRVEVFTTDIDPRSPDVRKADVMALPFEDNSFDAVAALGLLEHLPDPVRAAREIMRVAADQVFISVPCEPMASVTRLCFCLGWPREHMTVLAPSFFRYWFGPPVREAQVCFRRDYVALFSKSEAVKSGGFSG